MFLRKLILFLMCITGCFSTVAEVPHIFTPGQSANAEQVNSNFTALVNQIDQLQTQVEALQAATGDLNAASLQGTYDFFELDVDVDQYESPGGYGISGQSSKGYVVINADGTGMIYNIGASYRQLSFFHQERSVGNATNNGSTNIHSTDVMLNSDASIEPPMSMTWTLAGNVLSVTVDTEVTQLVMAGSRIMVGGKTDSEGQNGLLIVVRRQ